MGKNFPVRNLRDIEEIEKTPLSERIPEKSTLEFLEKGAAIHPQSWAITFLPSGEAYDQPVQISYEQFIGKVRQTANMLYVN